MQFVAIVLASILGAVVYGVVHDQFTARISIEYFTVGHVRLFDHDSPTLHGAAWGVIATWWVGLGLGVLLAVSARFGIRHKLDVRDVAPAIFGVMASSGMCAIAAGVVAWVLAATGNLTLSDYWLHHVSPAQHRGFLIDSWVHLGSYAGGLLAGPIAGVWAWRLRLQATLADE